MRVKNQMIVDSGGPAAILRPATAQLEVADSGALFRRDQLTVPICPQASPQDTLLYEDPARADRFYYLPRYEIVTENVSGQPRYQIQLDESPAGWLLSLQLNPFVPQELQASVGAASALQHSLNATLNFSSGGARQSRPFDQLEHLASGETRIGLTARTIAERDEIFAAMTDSTQNSELLLERKIEVAMAVQVQAPDPPSGLLTLRMQRVGDKITTIKVVRKFLNTGLAEAKRIVEQAVPFVLAKNLKRDFAAAFSRELAGARCRVEVLEAGDSGQRPPAAERFDIWLTAVGPNPDKLIALIGKVTGMHPIKAKRLISQQTPVRIFQGVSSNEARSLGRELRAIQARATLKPAQLARTTAQGTLPELVPRNDSIEVQPSRLTRPQLQFQGKKKVQIRGIDFTQYSLMVSNSEQFPAQLFAPSPELPPCGRNTNAARTWVDLLDQNGKRLYGYCALSHPDSLKKLAFNVKHSAQQPTGIRLQLHDRKLNQKVSSNLAETSTPEPVETQFRVGLFSVTQSLAPQPFIFDPFLHGYIFRFIDAPTGGELIRRQIQFEGRFFSYFVDAARRHIVYYLPDEFRLARRDNEPFHARCSVHIKTRDDDSDHADVTLFYVCVPVIEPARLEAAAAEFNTELSVEDQPVQMQPLPVMDFSFRITHPLESGTQSLERDVASSVFYEGILDTLVMPLPDFIACYAAMTEQTAASFHGSVKVPLPDDVEVDIPFTASLRDMAGSLFSSVATEAADNQIELTLINAIESPLEIQNLAVRLGRESEPALDGEISDAVFPVQLVPGESIALTVSSEQPLAGEGPIRATFDVREVQVLLDEEAMWDSILNRSNTDFYRIITVRAVANLFAPIAGQEDRQIVAILVHFEGGDSVELGPDILEATARVDYPVDDVVLRRTSSSSYSYSYEVARADGSVEQQPGGESDFERFFVSVTR